MMINQKLKLAGLLAPLGLFAVAFGGAQHVQAQHRPPAGLPYSAYHTAEFCGTDEDGNLRPTAILTGCRMFWDNWRDGFVEKLGDPGLYPSNPACWPETFTYTTEDWSVLQNNDIQVDINETVRDNGQVVIDVGATSYKLHCEGETIIAGVATSDGIVYETMGPIKFDHDWVDPETGETRPKGHLNLYLDYPKHCPPGTEFIVHVFTLNRSLSTVYRSTVPDQERYNAELQYGGAYTHITEDGQEITVPYEVLDMIDQGPEHLDALKEFIGYLERSWPERAVEYLFELLPFGNDAQAHAHEEAQNDSQTHRRRRQSNSQQRVPDDYWQQLAQRAAQRPVEVLRERTEDGEFRTLLEIYDTFQNPEQPTIPVQAASLPELVRHGLPFVGRVVSEARERLSEGLIDNAESALQSWKELVQNNNDDKRGRLELAR